jgi:hypothetical protein
MTAEEVVERAREAVEAAARRGGIPYKLGQGGMTPSAPFPWTIRGLDCTGWTAWALGFSRNHPEFGWINSDSMVKDGKSDGGLFTQVPVGDIADVLVWGGKNVSGRWRYGHAGLVMETRNGRPSLVAHCSAGNASSKRNALLITGPQVFDRNGAIAVRCHDILRPAPVEIEGVPV